MPIHIRWHHQEEDKRAVRKRLRGPRDLTLSTAHPQGGATRSAATTRAASVSPGFWLDAFPNLLVADASLFPTGCHVNPQMTDMALASLAAERIIASR